MMFSWYCIIAGLPVGGYENSTWTRCFCYDCLYSCHSKGPCCSEGETSSEVPSQSCRDGNRELNLYTFCCCLEIKLPAPQKFPQLPLLMFQHVGCLCGMVYLLNCILQHGVQWINNKHTAIQDPGQ